MSNHLEIAVSVLIDDANTIILTPRDDVPQDGSVFWRFKLDVLLIIVSGWIGDVSVFIE